MDDNPHEGLDTIEVLLPSEVRVGIYQTELLWAQHEGDDLYRIYSVPFLAVNLHVGDLVRCVAQPPGLPRVEAVVNRSGAQTVRLFFEEKVTDDEIREVLSVLRERDAVLEQGNRRFWAVGMRNNEDFEWALPQLEDFAARGILHFEMGHQPDLPFGS